MILEDFVMLGTTVPEPRTDGRISVCSAGISREAKTLIRIYPLARRNIPHRWHIYQVPVELNPTDHRKESYKLADAPARALGQHEDINQYFKEIGKIEDHQKAQLLAKYAVTSIEEANAKRLSLAIIHPESIELDFEYNPDSPDSPQLSLFEDSYERPSTGAQRFAYIPRLRFRDVDTNRHLMLRDWGCYEYMRKHGDERRHDLPGALHLNAASSLLVGNMNNQRNAWLVISVLNGLREEPSLFDGDTA